MEVDEIVVITLPGQTERQAFVRSQMPQDVPWRFYLAERDPDGGRAGCYRSHAEVLRSAQERGLRRVLVFEDDFRLLFEWPEVVRLANAALDEVEREDPSWSFLLLGMHAINIEHPSNSAVRRVKCANGGHAYIANIAHAGLPLPPYNGQHIDNKLFCDYYCESHRPAGVGDDTYGMNAVLISGVTSQIGEACSPPGRHVFATNRVLVHVKLGTKSSISDTHVMAQHAEELVGPDNLATFSTLFGFGALAMLLYFAVFAVAICMGAWLALARPASNMHVFAAALVALNVALVAASAGGKNSPPPLSCTYACYFIWTVDIPVLLVILACFAGALTYVLVSARRAVRFGDLLFVTLYTGGLFALALTVNTESVHEVVNAMTVLGAIGIGWVLFKPLFTPAIICLFGFFLVAVKALEARDMITHMVTGEKPGSLRLETSGGSERCEAARVALMGWVCFYLAFIGCALEPKTWHKDVFVQSPYRVDKTSR